MENWGSLLGNQLGVGFLLTVIINKLKAWDRAGWIGEHTEDLNKWLGVAASFFITLGFKFTTSGSAEEGYQIGIHTAPVGTMIESFVQMCTGVGAQQGFYQGSQLLKLLKQWQTMVMVTTTNSPPAAPKTHVDVFQIPPPNSPATVEGKE